MIKFRVTTLLFWVIFSNAFFAQQFEDRIDVTKYSFDIEIADLSNKIQVTEIIDFEIKEMNRVVQFNFTSLDSNNLGMVISKMFLNNEPITFVHVDNLLTFEIPESSAYNERSVKIVYAGVPKDGLIISENKFGKRTFFADNWPNRAQNWFACNDHPSDKAYVEMCITAPENYEIIANGILSKSTNKVLSKKTTCYTSSRLLSTKIIVFGAADFSIEKLENFDRFSLETWVYPENDSAWFEGMKISSDVLDFYENNLGEFPFEKLANVQSTTRFGGMENAGCVFYNENAQPGTRRFEELIAHEIAHQWFGNSATEKDWSHLWLSEGFATYLTNLYLEHTFGKEAFDSAMVKDRETVRRFYARKILPVIDIISKDPLVMLNPNAYQRGAWVLHLLRQEIGDSAFWNGIKTYHRNYQFGNATTSDFIDLIENLENIDLKKFKKQWLETAEIPSLLFKTKLKRKKLKLTLAQTQTVLLFEFPFEILVVFEDDSSEIIELTVFEKSTKFKKRFKQKIKSISLDPQVKMLFR